MDIVIVSVVAFMASCLTVFSGFGLGALLMPVVALFFPIEVALLGKHTQKQVLLKFGVLAVFAALLGCLAETDHALDYQWLGKDFQTTALKLIVGVLILWFVLLEFSKNFNALALNRKYLPLGGIVSGFFGGLAVHQGVFRNLFILKAGLIKQQFVATGVMVVLGKMMGLI